MLKPHEVRKEEFKVRLSLGIGIPRVKLCPVGFRSCSSMGNQPREDRMLIFVKEHRLAASAMILVLLVCTAGFTPTEPKHRIASAKGTGTLKIGNEEFKISSVVIKLMDDGKAEINLISEITVFITGTWARSANSKTEIDLQITGGASAGGFEGKGKLFLRPEQRSIERLSIQGASRTTKREVDLNFVAE
jgi:hypothetical protein